MRVFTPAQARSSSEDRASKDALRAKGLAEITQELLATKATVEHEFEETMRKQHLEAEEFFAAKIVTTKQLEDEVLSLEQRKKEALMPLDEQEKDIHSKEELLQARELQVKEKEVENEDNLRIFMRKLDELSTLKQNLDERESRVKRQESGIKLQSEQTAAGAKLLSQKVQAFESLLASTESKLAEKRSELKAKEQLYLVKDAALLTRERAIESDKITIQDQYKELEKGFEELRRNQS